MRFKSMKDRLFEYDPKEFMHKPIDPIIFRKTNYITAFKEIISKVPSNSFVLSQIDQSISSNLNHNKKLIKKNEDFLKLKLNQTQDSISTSDKKKLNLSCHYISRDEKPNVTHKSKFGTGQFG